MPFLNGFFSNPTRIAATALSRFKVLNSNFILFQYIFLRNKITSQLFITCYYRITVKLHSKAGKKPLSCLPFIIFTFDCVEWARGDDADENFSAANHANSLFVRLLVARLRRSRFSRISPFSMLRTGFVQGSLSHSVQPLNLKYLFCINLSALHMAKKGIFYNQQNKENWHRTVLSGLE